MKSHGLKGKGISSSSIPHLKHYKQSPNKLSVQNIGIGPSSSNITLDTSDPLDIPDSKIDGDIQGPSSNELAKYLVKNIELNTWTHDPKVSDEDVVIDMSLLPEGTKVGDVAELRKGPNSPKFYFNVVPIPEELKKKTSDIEVCFICV